MTSEIINMRVIPVAGEDSFLLNLSGGHAPFFTRNVVLLEDDAGRLGAGEVPGGAAIHSTLEKAAALVEGSAVRDYKQTLRRVRMRFADQGARRRGDQTYDLRVLVHVVTAIESALLDLHGQALELPVAELLGQYGQQRDAVDVLGYLFFIADSGRTDLDYRRRRREDCQDDWEVRRDREALTPGAIADLAAAAQARYGFRDFKLKGGVLEPAQEADCLRAIHERFPDARLTLDPNGAWTLAEALDTLAPLRHLLAYAEDPCGAEGDYSGREIMAEFRSQSGIATATNMIATDFRQLHHAIRQRSVDIPLADCHFWTLQGAVAVGEMCHHLGMTWGSHSNNHFDISLAMMTHVAAACPGPITAIDSHWIWQDGQRLTREPYAIRDGRLRVPAEPGLGIDIDFAALEAAHDRHQRLPGSGRDDARAMQYLIPGWQFDPKSPALVR